MFDNIIAYSIRHKLVVGIFIFALIGWGIYSLRQIPIDAVPDITNNQVQVITTSPTLATQEIEQFITTPVELALQNLQSVVEIRSLSRFGLSVVTVVFEEDFDLYLSRQLVSERLLEAAENIPDGLGTPKMGPISTGLGEIFQYLVKPEAGYEDQYSAMELRSIQDWIVARQLAGIEGVVEVNSLGGYLKRYEVAVDPVRLKSVGININEVFDALAASNENTGGAYIEKNPRTYYIRTNGIASSLEDIGNIVVDVRAGRPILVKDVAEVRFGEAPRYGAATTGGREVVSGTVMMLKGANSAAVTARVKERVKQIQKSLPEGVLIEPYLDRDKLISTAIGTVKTNLLEGGLIVIFILVLLLGNWRAGLIVASVIPLAMLFAVSMMNLLGISANLMSLGAIDFGLIIDGAVIIVESIVHRLGVNHAGHRLTQVEMDQQVEAASIKIRNSAAFGEIIILIVYLPILALVGIEGKMFQPMAQTVMLAIGGALILSLTYVPMMSALFLNKQISDKRTIADRIIGFFQKLYAPLLRLALRAKTLVILATLALFAFSIFVFSKMGGEFIPTLEEGDLALHQILPPGSSLSQSVEVSHVIQKKLMEDFPEIEKIVTKIGAAEIPTDPMPVETGDIIVVMKPKSEWVSATNRVDMHEAMEKTMSEIPGVASEYSQPIQMRFNELMTGSRADIAIKLYGDDLDQLTQSAEQAKTIIDQVPGVGTVKVEQTDGMPQLLVDYNYAKLAQYGLQVRDVNRVIRTAFAGQPAGTIYEGDRRFDLTVRLAENYRNDLEDVSALYLPVPGGAQVPLSAVASVELIDAPMQINRDNTNRHTIISVNVGDTDVQTLVEAIQAELDEKIDLPAGYYFTYGGQFENLQAASARLAVAVPVALLLIFILLYFTFGSFSQAALIFVAIPLSAIGGIFALELRGMPFSISAGIGFIALFGVAVLNGIVLIGYLNQLKEEGMTNVRQRILEGTRVRLRPVIMTAAVASLGFLPMALSNSGGAEVQRPLATVVIGGLLTATFLTLIVLPILYSWLEGKQRIKPQTLAPLLLLPLLLFSQKARAQVQEIGMEEAVEAAQLNHPALRAARSTTEQSRQLQDLPYAPGTTNLSYRGNGLFRANGQRVNQLGILQNFEHPAIVRAQNLRQDVLVRGNELNTSITAAGIRLEVEQLIYRMQYQNSLASLYSAYAIDAKEFSRIARLRADAGAGGLVEVNAAGRLVQETDFEAAFSRSQLSPLVSQLALITGSKTLVRNSDTLTLARRQSPQQPPSNTLQVQMANTQTNLAIAEITQAKAALKPSFQLGYSAQNYFEDGFLHGIEAGVNIPLFKGPQKQRIQALEVATEISRTNEELAALQVKQRYQETAAEMNRYLIRRQQLLKVQATDLRIAELTRLRYLAGEASYFEYQEAIKQIYATKLADQELLLNHNLAVARLRYLLTE